MLVQLAKISNTFQMKSLCDEYNNALQVLVFQNTTSKISFGVAKLSIKSLKHAPFGGFLC